MALLLHKPWKSEAVSARFLSQAPSGPGPVLSPPCPQGPALADATQVGAAMVSPAAEYTTASPAPSLCPLYLLQGSPEPASALRDFPGMCLHPAIPPCGWCAAVAWGGWPSWAALHHAQPGCHTAGATHSHPSRAAALRRLPVPWLYHDSFLASPAGLSAFPWHCASLHTILHEQHNDPGCMCKASLFST